MLKIPPAVAGLSWAWGVIPPFWWG